MINISNNIYEKFCTIKTDEAKLTQGFWISCVNNYMDIIHNLESALLQSKT